MSAIAASVAEPDSMARAKELLDLVKSPTAVATGVLLVFAKQQLAGNAGGIRRWATIWSGMAALAATLIALVLVAVMAPLNVRVVFTNRGGVETRLLVYVLTAMVALGTAIYSATVLFEVVREYGRGMKNGFT